MTLAAAGLVLLLAATPPATDGRLPFSTKSEAAAAAAREAMRTLVLTGHGAPFESLAQKTVDADREFALARYFLSAAFRASSREAAEVQLGKTKEMLPQANDAERRFIEAAMTPPWEAVAAWEALARDLPKEPLIHIRLGEAYRWRATRNIRELPPYEPDLDLARAAYEVALLLEPASAVAHDRLGQVNTDARDFAHALDHYLEGRALLGNKAACHGAVSSLTLAMAHLYVGEYKEAQAAMRQCRDEYLESEEDGTGPAWNLTGRVLLEAGDAEAALAAYEQGRAWIERTTWYENEQGLRQVWLGRYHHGRGRSLAKLGRHAEARAEVETVKKMIDGGGEAGRHHLPAYHYLAGYVELEAGNATGAIEHLEQARADGGGYAFRTLLLARAHDKLGHRDDARRLYRTIVDSRGTGVELAISFFEAKEALKRLE